MKSVYLTMAQPQIPQTLPETGEEALVETPALEPLPEEAAPVEEIAVPQQTEEQQSEEQQTEEQQTEEQQTEEQQTEEQQTGTVQPEPEPVVWHPALLWSSLGVLGGLVIGVVLCRLFRRGRRSKKTAKTIGSTQKLPQAESLQLQVSKLHRQGARSSQQDSFALSPAALIPTHGTLAVVCDGMGGLQDGDKVSQTAVSAMIDGFLELGGAPNQVLLSLLYRANQAVNRLLGPAGQRRSGTTLVAGILKQEEFHYVSVGDSRICLYRDGVLYQLNREHVYVNELSTRAVNDLLSFQEAWNDPQGAGLTSFLGMGELKYVDIPAGPLKVRRGDKLILMSDGVYNALTEQELCAALQNSAGADAEALGSAIADKAYDNQDNYTAVILTLS